MFFFTYRKERNDQNGNPRRFVSVWYIPSMGAEPITVKLNVNEGYIGMWNTVMYLVRAFAKENPDFNIDKNTVCPVQLPTGYKGG